MGRRNLPCSTVNAQTEKSMGARSGKQQQRFEQGDRILAAGERHGHAIAVADHLEAMTASPTLRSRVFSSSTTSDYSGPDVNMDFVARS